MMNDEEQPKDGQDPERNNGELIEEESKVKQSSRRSSRAGYDESCFFGVQPISTFGLHRGNKVSAQGFVFAMSPSAQPSMDSAGRMPKVRFPPFFRIALTVLLQLVCFDLEYAPPPLFSTYFHLTRSVAATLCGTYGLTYATYLNMPLSFD